MTQGSSDSFKDLLATVAVLGGGSFGTVLADLLSRKGNPTTLWMRSESKAENARTQRENVDYLPGIALDPQLAITADISTALAGAELILIAVPSKSFREVLKSAAPYIDNKAIVVSTSKGIESGSFKLMSQVIQDELPNNAYGVISGPNLARELAEQQITGTVIASPEEAICDKVAGILRSNTLKVYKSQDVFGVELAGVLKNIYAIIVGMASEMNIGQNTVSLLMTRGLAEMSRFAASLGADPMTFIGLAGMGDLIVTCSSPLSRNFRIGAAMGSGKNLQQAIDEVGQVAEGINTLKMVIEYSRKHDIEMPLANGLYEILFNNSTIEKEISAVMARDTSNDVEFVLK